MASEFKLPDLGEGIKEGTIVDLAIQEGDAIKQEQPLLEVEAGKATVSVPASAAGRITKVLVKKGDIVTPGQVLFLIDTVNGAASAPAETKVAPAKQPAAAAVSTPSPAPAVKAPAVPAPAPLPTSAPVAGDKLVAASPATRLLARELGVDLGHVKPSGNNGRVTTEDIKSYVRQLASGTAAPRAGAGGVAAPPLPDFARWGEVEKKPLDAVRLATARQMAVAWSLIPHVTQHDVADITDLEQFRREQSAKGGPKLTVTAFALKAAAIALQQFPQVNASLDLANHQLVTKKYYHIGMAVDTDRGLLVPVLRDVDKKSVHALAQELAEIAEKARERKITLADMSGGCFTITNLGGIGGTAFTPIVNWPEVAILGMSRSRLTPVIRDNGQIVPRLMLPLSLSYDHRVVDGADAARFTRRIVEMLENPLMMLLHA